MGVRFPSHRQGLCEEAFAGRQYLAGGLGTRRIYVQPDPEIGVYLFVCLLVTGWRLHDCFFPRVVRRGTKSWKETGQLKLRTGVMDCSSLRPAVQL